MSGSNGKNSNSDGEALFREAIGDVEPVRAKSRHREKKPPRARAEFRRRDDAAVMSESIDAVPDWADLETGEELVFRRPHITQRRFRQLRRGEYAIRATIDLHGMTAPEAKQALHTFIAECASDGPGCVIVVHGKGLRSGPSGPVLKHKVNIWLRQWDAVLAFASAIPRHGGTGAVYVLIA